MKYILMLALTIFMGTAYASPGDDGCVGNCDTGAGNTVTQSQQQQKQAQGQLQGQAQAAVAISEGSNAQSNSTIEVVTGGTNVNANSDYEEAAHSAASVFPQSCQEGTSGQNTSSGASTVFESAMCQSLKMAEVHQGYWKMYTEMGDTEQAAMHKKYMDEYVAKASESADFHYYPKNVGSFFLEILPIGLIALFL